MLVISCNNTSLFHKVLGVCRLCSKCFKSISKAVQLLVKVQTVGKQFNKKKSQIFFKHFTISKKAVKKQKRFFLLTIISKQHLSNMTVFLKSIKFSWVERSFVKQLLWNSFSFSQTLYDELFLILITLTPTMVQLFSSQTRKCSQNFSGHRIPDQTCK